MPKSRAAVALCLSLVGGCYASHELPGDVVAPPRVHPARDVNCDGYDDALIGISAGHGTVYGLYLGGPGGLTGPARTYGVDDAALPALDAVVAGDLDGDGCAEVAVEVVAYGDGCPAALALADGTCAGSAVLVYAGAHGGTGATPSAVLYATDTGHAPIAGSSATVAAAGDFDGDDLDDLAVLSRDAVLVYRGAREFPADRAPASGGGVPSVALPLPDGARPLLTTFASVGDVDGDGRDDLALASLAGGRPRAPAQLQVLHGGSALTAVLSDVIPLDAELDSLAAFDVDGDGHVDLVGVGSDGRMRVVLGPSFASSSVTDFPGIAGFSQSVVAVGHALVAVGDGDDLGGRAWVLGAAPPPVVAWTDALGAATDGTADLLDAAAVGDVDGDGHPDLLVGAPRHETAYLLRGTATGLARDAVVVPRPGGLAGMWFGGPVR